MSPTLQTYPTSFVLLSKQVTALMTLALNGQPEASIKLLTYESRCIASSLITYLRAPTSVLVNHNVLSGLRCGHKRAHPLRAAFDKNHHVELKYPLRCIEIPYDILPQNQSILPPQAPRQDSPRYSLDLR